MHVHLLHFAPCTAPDNRIVLLHIAQNDEKQKLKKNKIQSSPTRCAKCVCLCAFLYQYFSLILAALTSTLFNSIDKTSIWFSSAFFVSFMSALFFLFILSLSLHCVEARVYLCVRVQVWLCTSLQIFFGYLYATLLVIYDVHFISFELNQINWTMKILWSIAIKIKGSQLLLHSLRALGVAQ